MEDFIEHSPVALSAGEITHFEQYADLLLDWNKRMNLTAVTEREEVFVRHFLDSLTVIPVIERLVETPAIRLIDVGTGGGLPGVALAIVRPRWRITVLDATRKKVSAVEAIVSELGVHNVTPLWGRAETVAQAVEHREAYDVATARAVAELRELVEYCLPFVRLGGYMLAPKGSDVADEVSAAAHALDVLGGSFVEIVPVQVPALPQEHTIVVIHKTAPTPADYPRRPGRPAKRPL